MRLFGNIEAKTDAKGRVFLPVVFRKELATGGEERLVMRKDIHAMCLTLYPESVWNAELDALSARLNHWNATHRQILRQYMTDAEMLVLDGNGRLLLPRRYLQMVNIKQDTLFKGLGDRIEIWNPEEEQKARMEADVFARNIEEIMGSIPQD